MNIIQFIAVAKLENALGILNHRKTQIKIPAPTIHVAFQSLIFYIDDLRI